MSRADWEVSLWAVLGGIYICGVTADRELYVLSNIAGVWCGISRGSSTNKQGHSYRVNINLSIKTALSLQTYRDSSR